MVADSVNGSGLRFSTDGSYVAVNRKDDAYVLMIPQDKSLDLRLGLEPCNRYETHLLNTGKQTIQALDRIGAENTFVHLDTYHMNIFKLLVSQTL